MIKTLTDNNPALTLIVRFWNDAIDIWISGGWAMIGIAAIAFMTFALGLHIFLRLLEKGFLWMPERKWRQWIDHPELRRGRVGELLNFVTGSDSLKDTAVFFDELRTTEIAPFERDLKVMKICVSCAPLVGLLGTVVGMLATFSALSNGSGGDQTMAAVADGISTALITTETGLVIAIPGLFFQYMMQRMHEHYRVFITHLETVCTQSLYRKLKAESLNRPAQDSISVAVPVPA